MIEVTMLPQRVENVRVRKQNGEMAIFNILTADYFLLNETGVFIWNLCDGKHTTGEIIERVKEEFEDLPSEEVVAEETKRLIEKLYERELVELRDPEGE